MISRRQILLGSAASSLDAFANAVRLHVGNYGMQSMSVDAALDVIRTIGYDGAELCLMPGWPSEPGKLDAAARRRIREQRFPIPTMIENFNLLVSESEHARTLDRIRVAAELGRDISSRDAPILQSVLGGKPSEWEQVKEVMVQRLADWAKAAHESHIKLAVKSHVGSASDTPEKLVWLLNRVDNTALTGIYDYGHFQLLNLGLKQTLDVLLPRSVFITVKDGRMREGRPEFLLPGDGTIDYREYFSILREKRYSGWMLVEVSRQLQTRSTYDPVAAAKRSYEYLAPLLKVSKLRNAH